ncbi:MAG: hypothetical protein WB949_16725 [Candidatus Acidiferrales bacterium]
MAFFRQGVFARCDRLRTHETDTDGRARNVECGGSPPLFAARACPGVLHAFEEASDWARQASPKDGGGKPPHSTSAEASRALAEWVRDALGSSPRLVLPQPKM